MRLAILIGTAVVAGDEAALWVDGRYHLQASQQVDCNWIVMKEGLPATPTISEWLSQVLPSQETCRVGADPNLLCSSRWKQLSDELHAKGHLLTPVLPNLVDLVWDDRPPHPCSSVSTLEVKYAGKPWQAKVADVQKTMSGAKCEALVVAALDEIAWLLNLRGSDIAYNPVFFAYVVVLQDKLCLFIDEEKLTPSVRQHLGSASADGSDGKNIPVEIYSYFTFDEFIASHLGSTSGKIWLNHKLSQLMHDLVPESRKVCKTSPISLMKAVKNPVEIEGMKAAHVKDAVTLCQFFSWLEKQVHSGSEISESAAASKLEDIKREQDAYVSLSFSTISSSGANGSVIHYSPKPGLDSLIDKDAIYLLDSGAQYKDGTTDVTRTVHFGQPSEYEQECFTRVLKGHIALSATTFPVGTKGHRLDAIARSALWDVGLDYRHGTGHGVGSFLNVHEGPCAISYKTNPEEADLQEGMIVTIEPGYYENGKFGIRIENCVLVAPKTFSSKATSASAGSGAEFLAFVPLTLVPIQQKLLAPALLSAKETNWLNDYHNVCREMVAPVLKEKNLDDALTWLMRETEPIG